MLELRYNPLTNEWIIVSAETQRRPVQPSQQSCPICVGGVELAEEYDLVSFENRFPALKRNPPQVSSESDIFMKESSFGVCEVVVYTSKHDVALPGMPLRQIEKLVEMWVDRTVELFSHDFVEYVFIFENRGKEVGASLSHPHGQIYAFPFLPKRILAKIDAFSKWHERRGSCPVCDVVAEEVKIKKRVVLETDSLVSLVPFYARFPFEVHVYPKRHVTSLPELTSQERAELAKHLKTITLKYDGLYGQEFPYMMMFFQAPMKRLDAELFHLHVEFNPPKRDKDKIKWMASVETGTWAFINPMVPEQAAEMLRKVEVNGL
ncbi:galactose-1-phosphate uridylyltransferase [Pseudothermotoga sp.]